jgi:hypothetical protein
VAFSSSCLDQLGHACIDRVGKVYFRRGDKQRNLPELTKGVKRHGIVAIDFVPYFRSFLPRFTFYWLAHRFFHGYRSSSSVLVLGGKFVGKLRDTYIQCDV